MRVTILRRGTQLTDQTLAGSSSHVVEETPGEGHSSTRSTLRTFHSESDKFTFLRHRLLSEWKTELTKTFARSQADLPMVSRKSARESVITLGLKAFEDRWKGTEGLGGQELSDHSLQCSVTVEHDWVRVSYELENMQTGMTDVQSAYLHLSMFSHGQRDNEESGREAQSSGDQQECISRATGAPGCRGGQDAGK